MALLDIVDNADLTKLQRFVQATTLVPGDASVSAKDVNNLAKAVKAFAEAGAHAHCIAAMQQLVAAYADTPWQQDVAKRADSTIRRWRVKGWVQL